jgi:hypothetical protein
LSQATPGSSHFAFVARLDAQQSIRIVFGHSAIVFNDLHECIIDVRLRVRISVDPHSALNAYLM